MSAPDDGPQDAIKEAREAIAKFRRGMEAFADDMREKGIHVGYGNPVVCVNCGEEWPCPDSKTKP